MAGPSATAAPEFGYSRDVDAVLWLGQAEELEANSNFWDALERVNDELEETGLYRPHLFDEDQVILLPDWRSLRPRIEAGLEHIRLYRLSDTDLLLSKLMRDDPVDFGDVCFIIREAGLSNRQVQDALHAARVPDDPDIVDECCKARRRLEEWLQEQVRSV